jgi:hypothetical protein
MAEYDMGRTEGRRGNVMGKKKREDQRKIGRGKVSLKEISMT